MHTLTRIGRSIFAIGMIALGFLSIIVKNFIVGRPPLSAGDFTMNPALSYFAATVLIIAALLIILRKKIRTAAFLIALLIMVFSLSRHALAGFADWLNTYKCLALAGGALIIGTSFSGDTSKNIFTWAGRIALAIFFIAGGYAHFKFADFVVSFIPEYIPFRSFWAYFCGVCLIAGGIGILIPKTVRLAALLSGIMIGGWFVLLHIPRFINNVNDASDRMGLLESFTFAGIFFALAGMFSKKNKEAQ
ncbi:MAG: DoxX family membrane protein [Bacteroidota bacterium]